VSITQIHSFLVHPAKNEAERPEIRGTRLPRSGKLFQMLMDLYATAEAECDIDIVFRPEPDGRQVNECRDVFLRYVRDPSINNGRAIAARLQNVTTHRSGLGLLFLVVGDENQRVRLLLARFPADQGVIAQEEQQRLNLEFIERVFMKSAKAYKSVFYEGLPTDGNFWDGRAVDKQISNVRELSNYWIGEFLASELRTTGPAGTKRFAVALREAIRYSPDAQVRKDLLAASELHRGQNGRRISPERFAESLGLSGAAITALKDALPRPELFRETFQFDTQEFDRHAFFRSVELDNGAFLTAQNAQFDEIFRKEALQADGSRVRYTTEGTIVKEQLRKIR
jgi:hypothetical protein